ncbi:hypothetical protein HGRIS_010575 [Hohenbuehelia grisea]|uniref:FCP1 homology domain-containing protein n=1 Tax=Hohenbuehelia grisea TaxID=104357 RepID=A0ABR3IXC2_9AGAR
MSNRWRGRDYDHSYERSSRSRRYDDERRDSDDYRGSHYEASSRHDQRLYEWRDSGSWSSSHYEPSNGRAYDDDYDYRHREHSYDEHHYRNDAYAYTRSSSSRQSNRHHDRPSPRKRRRFSPPPQTNSQPIPQANPSPEYLAASLSLSHPLTDPLQVRKLLVLDLNGTLLYRAPHKPTPRTHTHPYANPYAPRPLRQVHPRPYLPAFRAYLAHPATRKWLDVAVWSSAQPHSVKDMVGRAFGGPAYAEGGGDGGGGADDVYADATKHLAAIWARNTLGLSVEAYHQKTQTTKDLVRLWDALARAKLDGGPPVPLPVPVPPRDAPASPRRPDVSADASRSPVTPDPSRSPITEPSIPHPPSNPDAPLNPIPDAPLNPIPDASLNPKPDAPLNPQHDTPAPPHPHSHHSTLLLDDSPLKARLQPWNHLCVQEYAAGMHARVVEWAAGWMRGRAGECEREGEGERERDGEVVEEKVAEGLEKKAGEGRRSSGTIGETEAAVPDGPKDAGHDSQSLDLASQSHSPNTRLERSTEHATEDIVTAHAQISSTIPILADTDSTADAHAASHGNTGTNSQTNSNSKTQTNVNSNTHSDSNSDPLAPDVTLLAVIGVLDAARVQSSVVAWVRRGGLWANSGSRSRSGSDADPGGSSLPPCADVSASESISVSVADVDANMNDAGKAAAAASRPAHEIDPAAWCADAHNVRWWAERGRVALRELGVEVEGVKGCLEG